MKRIYLEALTLHNFKGIKDLSLTFNPGENFIHGANGTGKTTIFDAFNWLLFGKNSSNQAVFEVKTIDPKTNKVVHKLSHEVEGVIRFDERTITLKKALSEKWTKKRGAAVEELTGHETKYFIDGVPKSANEFKLAVDLIIQEAISRTITDPMYFNTVVPWKERREILFKLANVKSDQELCFLNPDLKTAETIASILNSGKTIEDEKKRIAIEKKRLNEQIEEIPSRIDELDKSKIEVFGSVESMKEQISKLQSEKEALSKSLSSGVVDVTTERNTLNELNVQLNEVEANIREMISKESKRQNEERQNFINKQFEIENELSRINNQIQRLSNIHADLISEIESIEKEIEVLLSDLEKTKSRSFEFTSDCVCPTCGRSEDPLKIDAMKKQALDIFENDKQEAVERITSIGKAKRKLANEKNDSVEELKKSIAGLQEEKKIVEQKLHELGEAPSIQIVVSVDSPEYKLAIVDRDELFISIDEVKEQIDLKLQAKPDEQNEEIKAKIQEIDSMIKKFESSIFTVESNERIDARIEELLYNLKKLNQEKSELEKTEIQIENFVRWKIEKVEDLINDLFEFCTFKLFEEQLNGGFAEACVCTINGVPFNDLNTATKYKAGLDVIKTLQKWFNISAPIFIDGRESITELQNIDSQMINLIVDPTCKQLTQK